MKKHAYMDYTAGVYRDHSTLNPNSNCMYPLPVLTDHQQGMLEFGLSKLEHAKHGE